MKKYLAVLLALVLVLSLAACAKEQTTASNPSAETAETQTQTSAEDTPQMENALTVYSTLTEEQLNATLNAFAAVYPDVQVEMVNGGAGELLSRVEAEASNPQADVFYGGLADTDGDANAALFEPYVSIHDDELIPGAKSDNGFYNYTATSTVCFCVNTELEQELGLNIESYADLLDPALEGKILMADPNSSSSSWNNVCNIMSVFGCNTDEAWAYIEQLMPNLVIAPSSSATFNSIADGKYVVGLTYEPGVAVLLRNGAENIKMVYPKEGTSASLSAAAIVKNAPHPETAKVFIDFLMSAEGQQAQNEADPSRRTNAGVVLPDDGILPASDAITWVERPNAELIEQRDAILERWNQLFSTIFS